MSKLPTCSKCGSPMRLKSVRKGESRAWECTNNGFSVKEPCYNVEEIPDDYALSIIEMAHNVNASSGFSTSDELKKDQSNIRRILGGLKKLRLQPYMSSEESQALNKVVGLLERFGDAAEKAKKLKAEEEKAKKAARDKRMTEARVALEKRYNPKGIIDKVLYALSISPCLSSFSEGEFTWSTLTDIKKRIEYRAPLHPYTSATIDVDHYFNDCIASFVLDVGDSWRAVDEILADCFATIDAKYTELKSSKNSAITDFERWLIQKKIEESNQDLTKISQQGTRWQ